MNHVIAVLQNALDTAENNEPINRAAGNLAQADLERDVAAECRQAIAQLSNPVA
jgi:hypothetical protein